MTSINRHLFIRRRRERVVHALLIMGMYMFSVVVAGAMIYLIGLAVCPECIGP